MTTKNDRIYIRITTEVKKDFEKVAAFQGLKSSELLHSLIVKAIKYEKKKNPEIFDDSTEVPVMTLEEAKADDRKKRGKVTKPKQQ